MFSALLILSLISVLILISCVSVAPRYLSFSAGFISSLFAKYILFFLFSAMVLHLVLLRFRP